MTTGYEIDAAVKKLQDRVRRLELAVARNKPAAGIDYDDDGGSFGGGTLTMADVIAAIAAGTSPDSFLRTTLGGAGYVQALGTLGATEVIDLANANLFWGTLDQDCDITMVGWPNLKDSQITVIVWEDGTGGWTPTFTGVTWDGGGGTPAHDTTADTFTRYVFTSIDGGVTIIGNQTGAGSGSSSDLDATIAASSGQDIADALAGAAAPDAGNVFATMADVGGGGGASGYDLDTYSIDATYGDDFTGASLNTTLWTRRNFVSGAETAQLGKNATYMRFASTGRAVGDGYLQTAPGGDWTFAMAGVYRYWGSRVPWGICVLDSAGTGLGTVFYDSPIAFLVAGITTYTAYSGAFVQTPTTGTYFVEEQKIWQYLRKSGTNYYGAYSYDGEIWSPESPAFSSAITVDRVGMLIHPLGAVTTNYAEVDWFNKIA